MKKLQKMECILLTLAIAIGIFTTGCEQKKNETNDETTTLESTTTTEAREEVVVPEIEGYTLLWHDEFEGDTLAEEIWTREVRQPGWTNNELQEYCDSEENAFVRDGCLVLKAIKTTDENGDAYYTSGKVNSQNKQDFTYGKIVVNARVPEGQGLWPAIWMMPQVESRYGTWPKCGEIDIMEVLGSDTSTAYGTIHYGEPHASQQGIVTLGSSAFSRVFHQYSVEWEPGEIRWYIDGVLYLTVNDWFSAPLGLNEYEYPAPFNQPFFVQMNLAVGGDWPGNPDELTNFDNAEFEIDYVRVYQKPEYDTNVTKPELIFRDPLADGNEIYNGDFAEAEDLSDEENWTFLLFEGGEGSAEIVNNEIVITSENQGTVDYSVQLVQPDLAMRRGSKYRITFDAYAEEERDIIVCVSAPTNGWIRYFQDTLLTLSTEKTTYTYEFEMTERDDNNGRLEFNMGNRGSTATIHISNVRVEEIE